MISPGHAMTSIQGHFLSIDDQFRAILGREREEIIGKTIIEVTLDAHRAENRARLEELRRHGQAFTIRKTYVKGDGSFIKVQNHVSVMTDGVGGDRLVATIIPLTSDSMEFAIPALLETARKVVGERQLRSRILGRTWRSEDFLLLLLAVYILEAEGRSTVSSAVCQYARIGEQAGILALWELIGTDYLDPEGHSLDLRDVGLRLTAKGEALLSTYLQQLRETGTLV